MSNTFEKREKGYEAKFAHDEEIAFKAKVRRSKLVGLWAAGLMGLSGDAADAYAKEAVDAEIEGGEDGLFDKVYGDLVEKGVDRSDHQVRRELEEQLSVARTQILEEKTS
ncbi:MAG: DUF1476 domain-containing protein [Rhodospirillales bacterium]|nr:DUF1476 domain-containing protein [Rhodospirillales bacterium]